MLKNVELMCLLIHAVALILNMSKFKLAYLNVLLFPFLECFEAGSQCEVSCSVDTNESRDWLK